MTDYTKKTFSVAVGSDAYRDNWERVFGKKQEAPKETDDTLSAPERGYRAHIAEGMPPELAARIRDLRAYADKKWEEGRKESSQSAHNEAQRLTDLWRATVRPPVTW